MLLNDSVALIDNDFLSKFLSVNDSTEEEIIELSKKVFDSLDYTIAIHPLVYSKEMIGYKGIVDKAIGESIVALIEFKDIHNDESPRKLYYSYLIKDLFKKLNRSEFPNGNMDVWEYWKSQSNLGEIHSTVTCMVCNCGLFLSDDDDSRLLSEIIQNDFSYSIKIYNRKEIIKVAKENGVELSRHQTRSLTR